MSRQTFPRFLELPQELQIELRKHTVRDIPSINVMSVVAIFSQPEKLMPWFGMEDDRKEIKLTPPNGTTAYSGGCVLDKLFDILNTNRLARLIAFEFWRLMVQTGWVKSDADAPRMKFAYSKQEILALLGDFIDALRSPSA